MDIVYTEDHTTGWYMESGGVKAYAIDGHKVTREQFLAYVSEHPDEFDDPAWRNLGVLDQRDA